MREVGGLAVSGGRAELWPAFDEAIAALAPPVPKDLLLLSRTIADPARTAAQVLSELDAAVSSLHDEADHGRILTISAAAIFPDRLAGCREPLLRMVRDARPSGAIATTVGALSTLSLDDFMAGRWDEAQQLADEGLELARVGGSEWLLAWLFNHRKAGVGRFPFDLGRVRLCYGERLRRARATTDSRAQLAAAFEIFERLRARPWAARAASELRAAGQTDPRAGPRGRDSLTPQELEIAELAAAGLTNKQIGQRLLLSHRTVGAHLYQIFPKLGVTSRAALRDALDSLPQRAPTRSSQRLSTRDRLVHWHNRAQGAADPPQS